MNESTEEEKNKFLTEAMEECWHEREWYDGGPLFTHCRCRGCKKPWGTSIDSDSREKHYDEMYKNNNFFTWDGFGKLWKWCEQQKWWARFLEKALSDARDSGAYRNVFVLINPISFANVVYNFLKGDKE